MTNINVSIVFVYCPKSGDRLLAENIRHGDDIVAVQWSNGSRHVVGGVHLQYQCAAPGAAYWRTEARELARAIVAATGGIAWDDRGDISLIVPVRSAAAAADRLMRAARPAAAHSWQEDDANVVRLVEAGWGLELVGGQLQICTWRPPAAEAADAEQPPVDVVTVLGWTPDGDVPPQAEAYGRLQLFRPTRTEPVTITVPYNWAAFARPVVKGARLEVAVDEVDRPSWRWKKESERGAY